MPPYSHLEHYELLDKLAEHTSQYMSLLAKKGKGQDIERCHHATRQIQDEIKKRKSTSSKKKTSH
jgi:hypothetical protein